MGRPANVKLYKKFCKKTFAGHLFIPLKEFNTQIAKEIHPNTTYYRNRMITLGLIEVEYGVVKPKDL